MRLFQSEESERKTLGAHSSCNKNISHDILGIVSFIHAFPNDGDICCWVSEWHESIWFKYQLRNIYKDDFDYSRHLMCSDHFLLPFSLILTFYHLIFTYKTLLFAPFVHSFQSFSGKSEIFTFYRYFILFFLQTLDFSDHLTISSVSFVFFYLLFTYTNYRQIHLFLFVDSSIFR